MPLASMPIRWGSKRTSGHLGKGIREMDRGMSRKEQGEAHRDQHGSRARGSHRASKHFNTTRYCTKHMLGCSATSIPEALRADGDLLPVGELVDLLNSGGAVGGVTLCGKVLGHIA